MYLMICWIVNDTPKDLLYWLILCNMNEEDTEILHKQKVVQIISFSKQIAMQIITHSKGENLHYFLFVQMFTQE